MRRFSIGLPLLGLLVMASFIYPFIEDDSLISLRYAQRLLSGHGLSWTDGPPVEGYSNLLWILLAAALGALGVDLIVAVRVLGVVSVLVAVMVLHRAHSAATGAGRWSALVASVYLCLAGPVALWSIAGLEQPLVLALFALAAWQLRPLLDGTPIDNPNRQSLRVGGWLGLLCLTRPDSPLFVALFAVALLIARWSQGPRAAIQTTAAMLLLPVAAVLGQLGFRLAYYGDWLPNPATMKARVSRARFVEGLRYLGRGALYLSPSLLLASAGAVTAFRNPRTRLYAVLLFSCAVVWMTYVASIGGDHFPGHRHLVVVLMAGALLTALGLKSWTSAMSNRRASVLIGLLLLVAPGFALLQWADPDFQMGRRARWQWDGQVIGELFSDTFGQQQPLWAVTAAGCLPYFSGLPALDMLGLNDRHIARSAPDLAMPLAHEHGDGAYVLDRKPDLITFGLPEGAPPIFVSGEQMRRDPRFRREYQSVTFIGSRPHVVRNRSYVRLYGKIGIQQSEDRVVYPAYLLRGRVEGVQVSSGRMGARLPFTKPVRTSRLSLGPGDWLIRILPNGAPVKIAVASASSQKATYSAESSLLHTEARCELTLALTALADETLLEAVVLERQ